jgi:hypothetical protein
LFVDGLFVAHFEQRIMARPFAPANAPSIALIRPSANLHKGKSVGSRDGQTPFDSPKSRPAKLSQSELKSSYCRFGPDRISPSKAT